MYRGGSRGAFKPPTFLNRTDSGGGSDGQSASSIDSALTPQHRKANSSVQFPYDQDPRESPTISLSSTLRQPSLGGHPVYPTSPSLSLARTPSVTRQIGNSSATSLYQPIASSSRDTDEYYVCTWRKPQGRKHKTWDGDAVLIVNRGLGSCKLRCQESGRDLGMSNNFQATDINGGDGFTVGGKEVEIDRPISYREYLSGIPGEPIYPPKKVKAKHADSRATTSTTGSFESSALRTSGLLAAAPSASFYSKPLPKPREKQVASRLSPEVDRALRGAVSAKRQSSSSGTSSKSASLSIQPRSHGLYTPDSQAESRYDPKAVGAIVLRRPDEKHQRKYNRRNLPIVDVVVNPILAEALRPHQVEGVKFMYERATGIENVNDQKGAILADEMGLGKTLQTITLIETLLRQSPYYTSKPCVIEKALVVCPLSLVKNWKREFRKWLGPTTIGVVAVDGSKSKEVTQRFVTSKRDQVLVIGYEKLRSCIDILATAQPQIGLIVCDEGHRLKSKDTKTNKIFAQLPTTRRVILTGTPIQNDLSELYAMIDFVCPGLLGDYPVFKEIFEVPILKSRVQHCSKEVRELGAERSVTLTTVTQMVVIRRTADILDGFLLPKNETVLFCSPSELQLDLYRRVLKSTEVRALTTGSSGGSALPLITMLRQICDSPELLLKEGMASGNTNGTLASELLSDARHLFPSKKMIGDETLSGKLTVISSMLKTIKATTNDKVVLVSTFTSTLDVLEAFCKKSRYAYVRLDGQTKQDDRLDIVNTFNRLPVRSSFVFLLSTRAGGVGLNLIGANRLFLLEPEWNPALDQQAMARIHRDGQQKHCFIYRMMLSGTMDEKIFQRQITKLGLSDTLMSNSNAKERGDAGRGDAAVGITSKRGKGGDSFTQEELKDIFTLHEDTPCLCHDLLMCTCGGKGLFLDQGEQGEDTDAHRDEHVSDGDSSPPPAFIPASMQQASRDAQLAREARSRLAGLTDWRHVDLTHPTSFTQLNDEILNSVVAAQRPMISSKDGYDNVNLAHKDDEEKEGEASPPWSIAEGFPDEEDADAQIPGERKVKVLSISEATTLEALEESLIQDRQRRKAEAHGAMAAAAGAARADLNKGRDAAAKRREAGWNLSLFQGGTVLYAFTKTSAPSPDAGQEDDDDDDEERMVLQNGESSTSSVNEVVDEGIELQKAGRQAPSAAEASPASAALRFPDGDDDDDPPVLKQPVPRNVQRCCSTEDRDEDQEEEDALSALLDDELED